MSKKINYHLNAEFARIAGEAGAKVALETLEKEKKKNVRERRDRRLRNTKLLLRNYKMLVAHIESAIYDTCQLDERDSLDTFEIIESSLYNDDLYIESIKRSVERTFIIMKHVKEMVRIYEIHCELSTKPEEKRQYRVIRDRYLAEEEKSIQEIAINENIDIRTVYKDINVAIDKLSCLIFGIDGMQDTI